jgi:hypothetical protein
MAAELVERDYARTWVADAERRNTWALEEKTRALRWHHGRNYRFHNSARWGGSPTDSTAHTSVSDVTKTGRLWDDCALFVRNRHNVWIFDGVRLETAIYHFPTTMTRTWNKKEQIVEVESWIAPSWKRITEIPDLHDRMFVAENTPICLERILQACLTPKNVDLVYFMDMILVAETYAKSIDDCFGELLGLLEDFDKSWFGRGYSCPNQWDEGANRATSQRAGGWRSKSFVEAN